MTKTDKRRHIRVDSLNLSYVSIDENKVPIHEGMGRTLNVSVSGILLETAFPNEPGQGISLTVALDDALVEFRGVVVHSKAEENGKHTTGIEFVEMHPDHWKVLKEFIHTFQEMKKLEEETILYESDFPGLNLVKRGKVRDIYDLKNALLLVATDRISAFDVILPNPIPGKGILLKRISEFWFDQTSAIVPNHVISGNADEFPEECKPYKDLLLGRSLMVKKAKPLPVECIVRGYLSGSGWKSYQQTGEICGIRLPEGLRESDALPEPLFTPSTKAEMGEHDENISYEEMVKLIGKELSEKVRDLSLAIYRNGAALALERGIIIADTKFEFGICGKDLILIDEALTPDSSRFWPKDTYAPGRPQPSFDKQYVRDYLLSLDWDKKPPAPELPEEVVRKTREKYKKAYIMLTDIPDTME